MRKILLGVGQDGIVYKISNNRIIKVFWENTLNKKSKEIAESEFEKQKLAYKKGIKVPKPYSVYEVTLLKEDLKPIKQLQNQNLTINLKEYNLENGFTRFAIESEYIEGKTLDKYFFPKKSIKLKVLKLLDNIKQAGFVFIDTKAENFMITKKGEVYLIDCGHLYYKESNMGKIIQNKKAIISTSKIEEFFARYKQAKEDNNNNNNII